MQYFAIHSSPGTPTVLAAFNLETDRDAWTSRDPATRRHADKEDDTGDDPWRPAIWGAYPQPVLHGWMKVLPPAEPGLAADPENGFPDDPPDAEILPPQSNRREVKP